MANYRLIHKEAATGQRTSDLNDLEFRVWVQYMLSADDFGVCPATAAKLQGDNTYLEQKVSARKVQAAIERLVAIQLLQVFRDGGSRYLYQADWQDWQRLKHGANTSLPSIPAELLEKCSPKTVAFFREFHPKLRATLPPRVRACDASANTDAHANASADDPEEGPGETIPRRRVQGPLIQNSLGWDRRHGGHVPEFCEWVCLPDDLASQFASRLPDVPFEAGKRQVLEWARAIRAQWTADRRVPAERPYDFWNFRWEETHGSSKPKQGAAFDPLAGVKGFIGHE